MSDHLSRHQVGEWVRGVRCEQSSTKHVLQLIFDHAGPQEDGRWVAWVGNKQLAWEACFAEGANGARTIRRHLEALERIGVIEREERARPNGSQTTNRIVLLVGQGSRDREDSHAPEGSGVLPPRTGESSPPEAPPEAPGSVEGERAGERVDNTDARSQIPDGFPDDLRPHARIVMKVLRTVATDHPGAKEVTARAIGHVLMSRPRKPLVKAAYDYASWAADKQVRDVVAGYRNWVDNPRTPTLAGVEPLEGDAPAAHGQPSTPPGVTRLRPGRATAAEWDDYVDGTGGGVVEGTASE